MFKLFSSRKSRDKPNKQDQKIGKNLFLPNDLVIIILNYNQKKIDINDVTLSNLKTIHSNNKLLYLISKNDRYRKYFTNVYILHRLIRKYSSYQKSYEQFRSFKNEPRPYNPILLDLLFTNCSLPYAESSFDLFYTHRRLPVIDLKELKEDLEKIISILPSSVNSTYGQLRCRYNVSPLHAACINTNIPTNFIEILIKNGADMNHFILVNGHEVNIIDDITDNNLNDIRLNKIKKIFKKYS